MLEDGGSCWMGERFMLQDGRFLLEWERFMLEEGRFMLRGEFMLEGRVHLGGGEDHVRRWRFSSRNYKSLLMARM